MYNMEKFEKSQFWMGCIKVLSIGGFLYVLPIHYIECKSGNTAKNQRSMAGV